MMDTSSENMQISDTAASASLGRRLREARESLGLSVAEVADQTKFAVRQIEALEADDFEHLPEMTFVRGFVRSYAKLLHLDAEALFALLPQTGMAPQPLVSSSVGVPFPTAQSAQRINLVWLGGALLLAVLIVAFVVWQYTRPVVHDEAARVETPVALPEAVQTIGTEAAQAAVAEPVAPATVPAAKPVSPAPANNNTSANAAANPAGTSPDAGKPSALRLVFDEESWTEIRNRDDKIISSQVNPRGSELKLDGRAPFSLVIGHAASVHLYRRDKPVDLTPYINSSSEVARLTVE